MNNFNSVYIVLKFLIASNVYQRRDVLLFFPFSRNKQICGKEEHP